MLDARKVGRVTIPTDLDVVPQTLEILKKWGADAIRDCDGTDFPAELQNMATSLQLCTGKSIDRAAVAAAMIRSFEQMNRTLTDPTVFLPQYRTDCITVGQSISLLRSDEVRHGVALDVDEQGALVVRFDDGHIEAVQSGEVSIRGMYGYV